MRILIAEDDIASGKLIQKILAPYGESTICFDGEEAVHAFRLAWEEGEPYDLICMDIMMPNMDGKEALLHIRKIEKDMGVSGPDRAKAIMVTALDDPATVLDAFYKSGATSYLVKPITRQKLVEVMKWNQGEIDI